MRGVVKNIVVNRNFGFIREDVTNVEYFFHREDFYGHWDDLYMDAQSKKIHVEFDDAPSPKGPRAENVRRLDFPNQAA